MKKILARGTLFLMLAQLSIVLAGYTIHIAFSRFLTPREYGNLGIILSMIIIIKGLILVGINVAITKKIAENRSNENSVLKSGIIAQTIITLPLILIYVLWAGQIANYLNDPTLKGPLIYSSLVILSVGIYAIYSKGFLYGKRLFKAQMISELTNSFSKIIIAIVLGYLGFGIFGAITAYIASPLLALIPIRKVINISVIKAKINILNLLKFAIPITIFYFSMSVAMDFGLLTIKRILLDKNLTGIYTSANTIGKIVVSIFTGVVFSTFPSLSLAFSKNDMRMVRKYARQTIRYTLLILVPVSFLINLYSENIIVLLYPPSYINAYVVLEILIFGFSLFSIYFIFCGILWGLNKPWTTTITATLLLIISYIGNTLLVPAIGIKGAAIATTMTGALGVIWTYTIVNQKVKNFIDWKSTMKILFTSECVFVIGKFLGASQVTFIISGSILLTMNFLILIIVKEITYSDLLILKNILKKN